MNTIQKSTNGRVPPNKRNLLQLDYRSISQQPSRELSMRMFFSVVTYIPALFRKSNPRVPRHEPKSTSFICTVAFLALGYLSLAPAAASAQAQCWNTGYNGNRVHFVNGCNAPITVWWRTGTGSCAYRSNRPYPCVVEVYPGQSATTSSFRGEGQIQANICWTSDVIANRCYGG